MKKKLALILVLIIPLSIRMQAQIAAQPKHTVKAEKPDLTLWYTKPANNWLESFPLGNGRIGAMVFGNTGNERIVLNEATLYAEEPGGRPMPDITKDYDKVAKMIRDGEHMEADDYITKHWLGRSVPCYESLGDLYMKFDSTGAVSNYKRDLDLSTAVAKVHYTQNGTNFERDVFVSHADDAVIIKLKADKPGAIKFLMTLQTQHPTTKMVASEDKELVYTGQLPGLALRRTLEYVEEHNEQWKYPELWNPDGTRKPFAKQILYGAEVGNRGMYFEVRVKVLKCDGKVISDKDGMHIEGAREVVLALATASSYNGFDKSPSKEGVDPSSRTRPVIDKVSAKTYPQLLAAHIADHQRLFNRVSLNLQQTERSKLPTNERVDHYSSKLDPSLESLYFQFGRYLIISASRPGGQPMNLQGIWNVDRIPPWASDYTMNVNMNMNYWGVEETNLSECHEPVFQFLREASVTGKNVATQMYHRPGWVMHHNTSIWRDAQPVDWFSYVSFWPNGGGWMCEDLWEHYTYTNDRKFLRYTAYPLMKGAAEFYDSWLVEDANGHLLTPISNSPENMFFYTDKNGEQKQGGNTMGSTMDMSIIRELFRNTIAAAHLLNVDAEWIKKLQARYDKLLPYQIGSRGQLLEYYKEYKEVPPRHNTSPYYPFYPSNLITRRGTPALAAGEQKLFEERGRKNGGFPSAWLACDWARMGKGDLAESYLEPIVAASSINLMNGRRNVFQIDSNLGGVAAVAEMLIQSHEGEIELLPAIPGIWASGSVNGLCARGGFEVNMAWKDGKLTGATVKSTSGTSATVRYGEKTIKLKFQNGQTNHLNAKLELIK
jgi:alpha-L-fucosidase 2